MIRLIKKFFLIFVFKVGARAAPRRIVRWRVRIRFAIFANLFLAICARTRRPWPAAARACACGAAPALAWPIWLALASVFVSSRAIARACAARFARCRSLGGDEKLFRSFRKFFVARIFKNFCACRAVILILKFFVFRGPARGRPRGGRKSRVFFRVLKRFPLEL